MRGPRPSIPKPRDNFALYCACASPLLDIEFPPGPQGRSPASLPARLWCGANRPRREELRKAPSETLELEPQRHRHLPRVERGAVASQTAAGLNQYAVLPIVPIIAGTDAVAAEIGVVEDVVHLRPEDEHPFLVLQREVLRERHVEVGHARSRNIDQAARSGVPKALRGLPNTVDRIRRGRLTAREWNLERGCVDELVAGSPVGAVAAGRRAALTRGHRGAADERGGLADAG